MTKTVQDLLRYSSLKFFLEIFKGINLKKYMVATSSNKPDFFFWLIPYETQLFLRLQPWKNPGWIIPYFFRVAKAPIFSKLKIGCMLKGRFSITSIFEALYFLKWSPIFDSSALGLLICTLISENQGLDLNFCSF